MTPQPQPHKEAARYLKGFDFSGPFAHSSIGSDWPDSESPIPLRCLPFHEPARHADSCI